MTTAPNKPETLPIWQAKLQPMDYARSSWLQDHYPGTGVPDGERLELLAYSLKERFGVVLGSQQPVPLPDPPITLNYPCPQGGFLPDLFFFRFGWFCSARLRNAMNQPPEVAQWIPIRVQAPDPRVHAMDYQILRVLAGQPVIDLKRSEATVRHRKDRFIGGGYVYLEWVDRYALRQDLKPKAELFHAVESRLSIFCTDSLAERVMQAGCSGIEFADPERLQLSDRPHRIRTARGIGLTGRASRTAHLRLIRRLQGEA